jgi:hypothetical protein
MKVLEIRDLSTERPYDRLITMVVMVESVEPPNAQDVAAKSGYHPDGYGCYADQVDGIPGRDGLWRVTWRRGKSCE